MSRPVSSLVLAVVCGIVGLMIVKRFQQVSGGAKSVRRFDRICDRLLASRILEAE